MSFAPSPARFFSTQTLGFHPSTGFPSDPFSTSGSFNGGSNNNDFEDDNGFTQFLLAVILGTILPVIFIGIITFFLCRRWRRKKRERRAGNQVTLDDLPAESKYMDRNAPLPPPPPPSSEGKTAVEGMDHYYNKGYYQGNVSATPSHQEQTKMAAPWSPQPFVEKAEMEGMGGPKVMSYHQDHISANPSGVQNQYNQGIADVNRGSPQAHYDTNYRRDMSNAGPDGTQYHYNMSMGHQQGMVDANRGGTQDHNKTGYRIVNPSSTQEDHHTYYHPEIDYASSGSGISAPKFGHEPFTPPMKPPGPAPKGDITEAEIMGYLDDYRTRK